MRKTIFSMLCLLFSIWGASAQRATYFDLAQENPCSTCPNYTANLAQLPHYRPDQIQTAFKLLTTSGIQFNFPQGGCQNRAEMMSLLLARTAHIQHCRVWLFPPANLTPDATTKLELPDKNRLAPGNTIEWFYHVAPCVLVDRPSGVDTLVLDPALNARQPLKLDAWLSLITNAEVSKYTFLASDWYFFLTNANRLSGEFYKFELDPRYCGGDSYRNLTMERSLAINDMAIYIFQKYLVPLRTSPRSSDAASYAELQKLFGNVSALEAFFSNGQGYCGKTPDNNVSIRHFYAAYPTLLADAQTYYIQRVGYWAQRSTVLLDATIPAPH